MSQSHIKTEQAPTPSPVWWKVWLIPALMVVTSVVVLLVVNWIHSLPKNYSTTKAKILEIRQVVASTRESMYGGQIYYRIEAHVEDSSEGKSQDRWLRASDDESRESVELRLASHPTECLIYWLPKNPENARCSLK